MFIHRQLYGEETTHTNFYIDDMLYRQPTLAISISKQQHVLFPLFPFPQALWKEKKTQQSSPAYSTERIDEPIDDPRQTVACLEHPSGKIQQYLGISWFHPQIFQFSLLASYFTVLGLIQRRIHVRYWRRYGNVNDIPSGLIGEGVLIMGCVTKCVF